MTDAVFSLISKTSSSRTTELSCSNLQISIPLRISRCKHTQSHGQTASTSPPNSSGIFKKPNTIQHDVFGFLRAEPLGHFDRLSAGMGKAKTTGFAEGTNAKGECRSDKHACRYDRAGQLRLERSDSLTLSPFFCVFSVLLGYISV